MALSGLTKQDYIIRRLPCRVFVAVTVDGDNAVGVLVDHRALWVHAEGAHPVAVLLGTVDDLALVQLVRQARCSYTPPRAFRSQ